MLESIAGEYRRYRSLGERAAACVADAQLHERVHPDGNSLDVLMRHVGGNLHSRFTDFLTTDGEKEWRGRDAEFTEGLATRDDTLRVWTTGWETLMATLATLTPDDLTREVTIRGRPLTVTAALHRSLAHTAYHVGQIVQLVRTLHEGKWESLSIPRGESAMYAQRPDRERPPEG